MRNSMKQSMARLDTSGVGLAVGGSMVAEDPGFGGGSNMKALEASIAGGPVGLGGETGVGGGSAPQTPTSSLLLPEPPFQATLLTVLRLIYGAGPAMGDQLKRNFMEIVGDLLKTSSDSAILTSMLKFVGESLAATSKFTMPRADMILLLTSFSQRLKVLDDEALQSLFLGIIEGVFRNGPSLSTEEKKALHPAFLMGLHARDKTIRANVFRLWVQSIGAQSDVPSRLLFALGKENWEPIGDMLWYVQAVVLFLDTISEDAKFQYAPLTSQFVIPAKRATGRASGKPSAAKQMKTQSDTMTAVMEAHQSFVASCGSVSVKAVLSSLQELMWTHPELLRSMFVWLFPEVWKQCSDGQRLTLSLQINRLLEAPFMTKQPMSCNVVEVLLSSFGACEPVPVLQTKLLVSLAAPFAAWMPCHELLCRYLKLHKEAREDAVAQLAELYKLMGDQRTSVGVWRMLSDASPFTTAAVCAFQQSKWELVQRIVFKAMDSGSEESAESRMWEEAWLESAKRLGQWSLLMDYGRSKFDLDLLIQCSWKVDDWRSMQDAIKGSSSSPHSNTSVAGSMMSGLYNIMCAIVGDGSKLDSVKSTVSESLSSGLRAWAGLPYGSQLSNGHLSMVRVFQRVVEAQESFHLVREVTSAKRRANAITEIKNKLSNWRDRTPNAWSDPLDWSDVLLWRHHIFGVLNKYLSTSLEIDPAVNYLGYQELAWSLCAHSHAMRKQGLVQGALDSLSKVYLLPNLQLDDAFHKLSEQVKCYLQLPTFFNDAISIFNLTNTEFFGPRQLAEWNVLRGRLHHVQALQSGLSPEAKSHFLDQANRDFNDATSQLNTHASSWIHWGLLCDQRVQLTSNADEKKQWREYLFSCFLKAIAQDPARGRKYLGKLLSQLASDDQGEHFAAWEKVQKDLPQWIFLDRITQLIMMFLSRPESNVLEQSLSFLANTHPVATYNWLRATVTMLEECKALPSQPREIVSRIEKTAAVLSKISTGIVQQKLEVQMMEELCNGLDSAFAETWQEEDLCAGLWRVVRDVEAELLNKVSSAGAISNSVKSQLAELAQKHEVVQEVSKLASGKTAKLSALHPKLNALWLSVRLKTQRSIQGRLQAYQQSMSRIVEAYDGSMEFPTNYMGNVTEDSWNHPVRGRLLSRVKVVPCVTGGSVDIFLSLFTGSGAHRRLQLKRFHNATELLREDRLEQLRCFANEILSGAGVALKDRFRFSQRLYFPLGSRVALRERDASLTSLWDMLIAHWRRNGIAENALFNALSKNETFSALLGSLTPETVISDFIARKVEDAGALLACRTSLARNLSLESCLSWILRVPDSHLKPENISIGLPSGDMHYHGLSADYQFAGQLSFEPVTDKQIHMRMTPNLVHMIGPVGLRAVVIPSFYAMLSAFHNSKDRVRDMLEMYFRDDVVLWSLQHGQNVFDNTAVIKTFSSESVNEILADVSRMVETEEKDDAPLDQAVADLLAAASSHQNLESKSGSFFPSF